MPAPKKRALDAPTPTAPVSKQPVAVGDVVLYAHRVQQPINNGTSAIHMIPMMVTRTYRDDTTIDGVLFSADPQHFRAGTGTKPLEQVPYGEEEGKWRPR